MYIYNTIIYKTIHSFQQNNSKNFEEFLIKLVLINNKAYQEKYIEVKSTTIVLSLLSNLIFIHYNTKNMNL